MKSLICTIARAGLSALTALGLTLIGTAPVAASDYALIVGVNQYPNLQSGASLAGCVNDAGRMAATLKKYGFQVTVLTDSQANKRGILAALDHFKSSLASSDRFVFYFAGHGTLDSSGASVMLPNDAQENSEANDIQTGELYSALQAVPATSKTVILDSCYSGGMMRSLRRHTGLKSRYYMRSGLRRRLARDGKKWTAAPSNKQDSMHDVAPNGGGNTGGICYYTGCMGNEVSSEKDIDGARDGLFTYYLTERLTGQGDLWQDISSAVNKHVADDTDDLQHPRLSPAFLNRKCFDQNGGGDDPKPRPSPANLADLYGTVNPDPDKVELSIAPAAGPIAIGQKVRFQVNVGQEGYLVLLGRDPNDEIYVLYPRKGGASAAKVNTGRIDLGSFSPDTAGTDRVKAFLFSTQEGADRMLSAMTDAGGAGRSGKRSKILSAMRTRKWHVADNADGADFYTSEMTTEIVPKSEANQ